MPVLYLDEDVRPEIADLLVTPDRFIRSARDERRLGAGDAYQLMYAAERDWMLVTCNRKHYHLLHDAWLLWSHHWGVTREHAGILTLDQGILARAMVAAIPGRFVADR